MKQKNDVITKRKSKDNAKHHSHSAEFKQEQKEKNNTNAPKQS